LKPISVRSFMQGHRGNGILASEQLLSTGISVAIKSNDEFGMPFRVLGSFRVIKFRKICYKSKPVTKCLWFASRAAVDSVGYAAGTIILFEGFMCTRFECCG